MSKLFSRVKTYGTTADKMHAYQRVASDEGADVPPEVRNQGLRAGEETLQENVAGGLGRHLGVVSTTLLIIGRMIGSGIFSTPSSILSSVGSVGAALLLWLAGLVLSFAGLFIWLELGCMIPRSGGAKVYLEAAYTYPKLLVTVVFAIQAVVLGFTAQGCIVFASNMVLASGHTSTAWQQKLIAVIAITLITVVHTIMPKIGIKGMNFFGFLKVGLLLFVVFTGFAVLGGASPNVPDPGASFRHAFEGSAVSANLYATALFKVLHSYAGWNVASSVLNEVRDPVRTLKISGVLGLTICGALNILANVAYFAAETPEEVIKSKVTVAAYFMGKVFGPAAQRALSVLVALSAFGNVMTSTFALSRVNQEVAKEGVIPYPRFWASSWPFGSPSGGLLLHYIPSFIVITMIPFGDAYNFIVDLEVYAGTVVSFFVVLGFFVLRWKVPNAKRPFKVWWPVAALYLLVQASLIIAPFMQPPEGKGDTSLPYWLTSLIGTLVLLGGVVYWAVWQKVLPRFGGYRLVPVHHQLTDGTNVIVYERKLI